MIRHRRCQWCLAAAASSRTALAPAARSRSRHPRGPAALGRAAGASPRRPTSSSASAIGEKDLEKLGSRTYNEIENVRSHQRLHAVCLSSCGAWSGPLGMGQPGGLGTPRGAGAGGARGPFRTPRRPMFGAPARSARRGPFGSPLFFSPTPFAASSPISRLFYSSPTEGGRSQKRLRPPGCHNFFDRCSRSTPCPAR